MKLTIEMANAQLLRTLREVRPELRKGAKQLVRDGAKLALRKAIEMTPPFDMNNTDNTLAAGSKEAQRRGENAIYQDAFGGSRGAKNNTKRSGIFFVANESLLKKWHSKNPDGETERLFVRKDGSVWATEKRFYQPNADLGTMDAHHARYWNKGRMTSAGTRDRTIGRWVFIDRMVIGKGAKSAFLKARYKRIGFLAAGWLDAANKLKIGRVPAWIGRHKAPGSMRESDGTDTFSIYMINGVRFGANAHLARIVPTAIAAASKGMKAQAKHVAQKRMRAAGFTLTSATSLA